MFWQILGGAALGALAGLAWQRLAGCPDGACPITRSPWTSALYGMFLGALLAGSL